MGYIAALFIGISLGLIGGGGSILTVPVLVYLFGIPPLIATTYSLFVVGITSLAGSLSYYRQGWIDMKTVYLFGLSSILTVFLTRKFVIPFIPDQIVLGSLHVSFPVLTMVLFAVLMLIAAVLMIKGKEENVYAQEGNKNTGKLTLYGVAIGIITGFLGAGGGFLLIPALILLVHLPMKKAVGTSLLIIALNSLIGFLADVGQFPMHWSLLLTVSGMALTGIFLGGLLGKKIKSAQLKKGFGWFVLVMGTYIIVRELFLKNI